MFIISPSPWASAQKTWVGNGSSQFWDVTTNWSGNTLPSALDDVQNTTGFTINHRSGTDNINSFTTNGAFILSGGILSVANVFSFAGGSFQMAGGTLKNATIQNSDNITFTNNANNVFDGVTLQATVGSGMALNIGTASSVGLVRLANNVAFANGSGFNLGSGINYGSLLFDSTVANPNVIFNNAAVTFNSGQSANDGFSSRLGFGSGFSTGTNSLTLGTNLVVQGKYATIGTTSSFTVGTGSLLVNNTTLSSELGGLWSVSAPNLNNTGTMQAVGLNGAASTLAIGGGTTFNNTGIIRAQAGGQVTIGAFGSLTNLGTIQANGVSSTGIISTTALNFNLTSGQLLSGGISVSGGGRIDLGGTVNNTGNTLDVATLTGASNANGILRLNGGTILGGTLASTELLAPANNTNNLLNGVTLTGTGLNSGSLTTLGRVRLADVSYTNGFVFTVGSNSYLQIDSTSANPNPVFDNAVLNLSLSSSPGYFGFGNGFSGASTNTLTLGSNLIVQGKYANIGTLNLNTFSNAITLVNNTTLSSNQGGMWVVGAPFITNKANGVIEARNANSVFNVSTGTVTNAGSIQAENGGSITLGGVKNTGLIQAEGTGSTLTLGGIDNTGTFRAQLGATVTISSFVAVTNLGTVQANGANSVFNLSANAASSQLSGVTVSNGGRVNLNRTLTNTGATLDVASIVGANSVNGSLYLNGNTTTNAIIIGGTLNNAQLLGLTANAGNVLDGVTLANTLGGTSVLNIGTATTPGAVRFANNVGFTANNSVINLGSGSALYVDSTTNTPNPLLANVTLNSFSSTGSGYLAFGKGFDTGSNTLTLGSNLNIIGKTLYIGDIAGYGASSSYYLVSSTASLVNNTTLSSNQNGSWRISAPILTNNAGKVIEARNDSASVSPNSALYLSASAALNNLGTIRAVNNGGITSLIGANSGTTTLNNTGSLLAENGGWLLINTFSPTSYLGTVQANGTNSRVDLSTNLTTAQLSGVTVSGGGRVNLNNTITNTGASFDVASVVGADGANGFLFLNNGAIKGGTLNNSQLLSYSTFLDNLLSGVTLVNSNGGTTVLNAGTSTLPGYVHLADISYANGSVFNLASGSQFNIDSTTATPNPTFDNATINSSPTSYVSQLTFGSGFGVGTTNTLTLGSNLNLQGKYASFGSLSSFNVSTSTQLINNTKVISDEGGSWIISAPNLINSVGGVLAADAVNSRLTIGSGSSTVFTNNGLVRATNGGTVNISGTAALLGTVQVTGAGSGLYLVSSTYTSSDLNNASASGGGYIFLDGTTITGGTITPQILNFTSRTGNILGNLTLSGSGPLNVGTSTAGGVVRLADVAYANGFTFNVAGSSYLLFDSTSTNPSINLNNITINSGDTTTGTGYIGYGNGFDNGSKTLTLGSALTIAGKNASIGSVGLYTPSVTTTLINNAALASAQGGTWTVSSPTVTNNTIATLNASGTSSSLTVSSTTFNNNGTVEAATGAAVTLSSTTTNNNSGAVIRATGTSARVNGSTSVTNAGTIESLNGGTVAFSSSATNTGTITVGSGSTMSASSVTQTAGATTVNGTLTPGSFILQGGTLVGNGTITGTLSETGGTLSAGSLTTAGTLTLNGGWTQSAGSIFSVQLGGTTQGTQYDYFNISGNASLGGALSVDFVNGFTPPNQSQYQIIRYGSNTGNTKFSNADTTYTSANGYQFLVNYAANGVFLTSFSTPEPGTAFLLLPGGVVLMGAMAKRKKKK